MLCFRANCIAECYTEKALAYCGCVPWDYNPIEQQTQPGPRICDFYGHSCFNSFLEKGLASTCKKMCVTSCNEVKYTVLIEKEGLDSEGICSGKSDLDLFELRALDHVKEQRNTTHGEAIAKFQIFSFVSIGHS